MILKSRNDRQFLNRRNGRQAAPALCVNTLA